MPDSRLCECLRILLFNLIQEIHRLCGISNHLINIVSETDFDLESKFFLISCFLFSSEIDKFSFSAYAQFTQHENPFIKAISFLIYFKFYSSDLDSILIAIQIILASQHPIIIYLAFLLFWKNYDKLNNPPEVPILDIISIFLTLIQRLHFDKTTEILIFFVSTFNQQLIPILPQIVDSLFCSWNSNSNSDYENPYSELEYISIIINIIPFNSAFLYENFQSILQFVSSRFQKSVDGFAQIIYALIRKIDKIPDSIQHFLPMIHLIEERSDLIFPIPTICFIFCELISKTSFNIINQITEICNSFLQLSDLPEVESSVLTTFFWISFCRFNLNYSSLDISFHYFKYRSEHRIVSASFLIISVYIINGYCSNEKEFYE
jgi:hypothetical protein